MLLSIFFGSEIVVGEPNYYEKLNSPFIGTTGNQIMRLDLADTYTCAVLPAHVAPAGGVLVVVVRPPAGRWDPHVQSCAYVRRAIDVRPWI